MQVADRHVSVPMTSSELERRDARDLFFRRTLICMVCPRLTEIGTVRQVGERHVSRGSAVPIGWGPASPNFFDPTALPTKFGTKTHVWDERIFRGQPGPRPKGRGLSASKFLGPLPTPKRFDLERSNFM